MFCLVTWKDGSTRLRRESREDGDFPFGPGSVEPAEVVGVGDAEGS